MKPNVFKYSVLSLGIVAAMGVTGIANAATEQSVTGTALIENTATATYSVEGDKQTDVISNIVTINIEEIAAFSLIATNEDTGVTIGAVADDDKNEQVEVIPTGIAAYNHTLTNAGNLTDTYTMALLSNKTAAQLDNISVSYIIYNVGGIPAITSDNALGVTVADLSGTDFDTSAITLEASQYAKIVINETTVGNKGGETQNLTLTATSNYFTNATDSPEADVTNTSDLITKLPVFGIVKTVTNPLDLNNPASKAAYKIVVTNDNSGEYAADAIDISIIDNLPAGLKLVAGSVKSTDATGTDTPAVTENGNGAGSGSDDDGFVYSGINLAKDESVTITFEVTKDVDEDEGFETLTTVNHARVEVTLGGVGDVAQYTVTDSTDGTGGGQNTGTYYTTLGDSQVLDIDASGIGGDSTETLTIVQRGLAILSSSDDKEVPTTSNATSIATHTAVITNTGNQVEGEIADEVTFSIVDSETNELINIDGDVTIAYDADGEDGAAAGDPTTITAVEGIYDINTVLSGGMAADADSTVTISYKVASAGAALNDFETTKVTLIPGNGNGAANNSVPTVTDPIITDTTTVRGLTLLKTQALDADCADGADGAFSQDDVAATPGQCVVYKILATNTFSDLSSFSLSDVVISEPFTNFDTNADYVEESATTTTTGEEVTITVPAFKDTDAITTTVTPLVFAQTATLQYSIKIKANAAKVTPTPAGP
ncbi:hypothetical protein [Psychrobacter sp. CAL346-MNA-CIBAN-0220]|uniref:hypothetical protein n=1 Tax=Psychrobacter sp. CAL346-MNA-CIBAN-0220 TaxID=3140457 RepID=UPI00331FDD20